ncbi:MAG: hypothetical protein ACLSFT_07870 [Ruminococcus callidus]
MQPRLQLILQQQCRQPAGGKLHIGGAVFLHQPELFHCPEVQFRAVQQQHPIDAGELLYAEIPVHRRRHGCRAVGFLVQRKGGNAVCKICLPVLVINTTCIVLLLPFPPSHGSGVGSDQCQPTGQYAQPPFPKSYTLPLVPKPQILQIKGEQCPSRMAVSNARTTSGCLRSRICRPAPTVCTAAGIAHSLLLYTALLARLVPESFQPAA